jgi:hypothetical protein
MFAASRRIAQVPLSAASGCSRIAQPTFAARQAVTQIAPMADIAAEALTTCWKPREKPVW